MSEMLVRRYAPRGAARQLFSARNPEVLISGPAGTGKSRACLEKMHLAALKYPKMRGLILRKTASSLTSTTLVTWRERVVAEGVAAGILHFYGGSAQRAAQYQYRNGSTITIGGLDKPTKIMSSEYDMAYIGEAIELNVNDWEAVTTRLRNGVMPYQQLLADTNPDAEHHWLKQRCNAGQTLLLESRHADNPIYVNPDGSHTDAGVKYIDGVLANLTGVRKLRLADGKWVSSEGVIYEDYDPAVHLVDKFDVPDSWTRWWSVDFGYVNPFVLQCWAQNPDGRLVLYREIYMTGRTVDMHASQIMGIVAPSGVWKEPKPRAVVTDHDAEGRATFEQRVGLSTVAANKKVLDGIQAVQRRLVVQRGKPGLILMRDCVVERDPTLIESVKPTCTQEELPGYIWDLGNGKTAKEQPVKLDDHGADALRYVVAQVDLGARPRVRFI